MKSHSVSIHPLAQHFLDHDLAFELKEEGRSLISGFRRKNASLDFIARFNAENFLLLVQVPLPLRAATNQRHAVAEFCNRINDALVFGNFEVSTESGIVQFRVATCLASAEPVPEFVARRIVGTALSAADELYPAFVNVIEHGLPAELALGASRHSASN